MIKLIASDLDGTIINHNNACDPSTVEAVKRVRDMGIKFAICTGRPIDSMTPFLKEWGLYGNVDYIVGSNGGEVLEIATKKHAITYDLSREVLKDVLDLYTPLGIIPSVYDGQILYVQEPSEFTAKICKRIGVIEKQGNIYDLIDRPTIKLMFLVKEDQMADVEKFYNEHLDDRYVGFKTAVDLFEVSNPLLAKDVGVEMVSAMMHISLDEVMAFGDTSNDVAMLSKVKYGIVMANGSPDAKAIAFDQTKSIEENGFAYYLNNHVKNGEYVK